MRLYFKTSIYSIGYCTIPWFWRKAKYIEANPEGASKMSSWQQVSYTFYFQDKFTADSLVYTGAEKKKKKSRIWFPQTHHQCLLALSIFASLMKPSFPELCCQSRLCRCRLPTCTHCLALSCFLSDRTHCKLSFKCCPRQVWNMGPTVFLAHCFP